MKTIFVYIVAGQIIGFLLADWTKAHCSPPPPTIIETEIIAVAWGVLFPIALAALALERTGLIKSHVEICTP